MILHEMPYFDELPFCDFGDIFVYKYLHICCIIFCVVNNNN